MSVKDVRTVQRRFKLFQKNWREFQNKDLIVKKSVIVDDGATFKPQISKKSEQLLRNKELGNLEFPMSTRSDSKAQRRQRVWERDLPKGIKSKERLHDLKELDDDRRTWLLQTAPQSSASGLPFSSQQRNTLDEGTSGFGHYASRADHQQESHPSSDYFAVGAKDQRTIGSSTCTSGKASTREKRGLTNPNMTHRMEQIYQIGKHKLLTRQDQDRNLSEFD